MSYERPQRMIENEDFKAASPTEHSLLKTEVTPSPIPAGPVRVSARNHDKMSRRKWLRIPRPPLFLFSFFLFVIIPSVGSQMYFAFIAADQYEASVRFAVKSAQDDGPTIGDMSPGALGQLNLAGQDAHVIVAYIRSRGIIEDLSKSIDIRAIFSRPEADFWARLKKKASIEDLTDYWLQMVGTNIDGPSGIVTVSVRAFRRQDALDLTKAILSASEALVNDVSLRARRDAMNRAESEVRRSEGLVQQALSDMRQYRDQVGFVDPMATATMMAKLVSQAVGEKILLENELFVATRTMSSSAPSLNALTARLQAVNEQIDKLRAQMTSSSKSDAPLSNALVKFEELELKRVFAEKLYTLSQDALERARVRSERQNIYVIVFVPPMLPEEARFPDRISWSIIIPLSLLVLWGIGALLVATIEDHRN